MTSAGLQARGVVQGFRSSQRVWIFLALFIAAWLLSLTGFNSADEAWTMQVVHRVRAGTVLYREAFLGVTPLSIWAGLGWTALFGAGVASFKALAAFQFATSALLIQELAHRCGLRGTALIALPVALLGSAWNPQASLYPGLASLGGVASLMMLLQGKDQTTRRSLAWAGLFAGLAFAAKQTIGVFALGAAVASLPLLGLGPRSILPLVGGFLLGALPPLIPVVWQGGLPDLWEYGFAGKGLYLRTTSFLYLESLGGLRALLDPTATLVWFRQGVGGLAFLLPPLALAVWLGPRRGRGEHRTAMDLVGLSSLSALAGTLPMADAYHLSFAMPQCVLLLLLGLDLDRSTADPIRIPWRRWCAGAVWAWALVLVAGRFGGGAMRFLGRGSQPSRLPYFAGLPALPQERGGIEASLAQLVAVAGGRPVFILSRGASAWYLATGLRNPTAYDYPTVPAFGRTGEARIIAQIEQGRIPLVAVRADAIDRWPRTERLEAWIRQRMTPQGRAGEFELYGPPEDRQ